MIEHRSVSAFSLIELVAALALAAVLTVAVVAAMHSISAGMRSAEPAAPSVDRDAPLADLVRFDLSQASSIRQADGSLFLAGYSGLDRSTLQPTHRPVLVTYSQKMIANRSWLVREQTALDVLSTTGTWSELVAADAPVPAISAVPTVPILPPDASDNSHAVVNKTPYVFQRLRMQPMPGAVAVVIARTGGSPLSFRLFLP